MARGRPSRLRLSLTEAEHATLAAWQRSSTMPMGVVRRARILLLVVEGQRITDIAAQVGISRRFVYKWVERFQAQGLDGLMDQPRRPVATRG